MFTKEQREELMKTGFVEPMVLAVLGDIFNQAQLNQYRQFLSSMSHNLVGPSKSVEFMLPEEMHQNLIDAIAPKNDIGIVGMSLDEVVTETESYNFRILFNSQQFLENVEAVQQYLHMATDDINQTIDIKLDEIIMLKGFKEKGSNFVNKFNEFFIANNKVEEPENTSDTSELEQVVEESMVVEEQSQCDCETPCDECACATETMEPVEMFENVVDVSGADDVEFVDVPDTDEQK